MRSVFQFSMSSCFCFPQKFSPSEGSIQRSLQDLQRTQGLWLWIVGQSCPYEPIWEGFGFIAATSTAGWSTLIVHWFDSNRVAGTSSLLQVAALLLLKQHNIIYIIIYNYIYTVWLFALGVFSQHQYSCGPKPDHGNRWNIGRCFAALLDVFRTGFWPFCWTWLPDLAENSSISL